MTWQTAFTQSLGFISFGLFMVAYQIKDTRRTQLWFAPGNFLYGVQYYMLGSFSASLIMFAASLRDLAGWKGSDRVLRIASVIYIVWIWGVFFLLHKNWQEVLMPLSGTVSTIAVQFRSHFYRFRFLLMGRQTIMFCFNIWIQSCGGIVHLFMAMGSNIVGTWRHYKTPAAPADKPAEE